MPDLVLVMIGGAAGSAARYLVGRATIVAFGADFPWGTLIVNVAGGLVMGGVAAMLARAGTAGTAGAEQARLLIAVGVLGGFTTFSAFSLETVRMIERGDWMMASGYVLASVIGSILALAGGMALARGFA